MSLWMVRAGRHGEQEDTALRGGRRNGKKTFQDYMNL